MDIVNARLISAQVNRICSYVEERARLRKEANGKQLCLDSQLYLNWLYAGLMVAHHLAILDMQELNVYAKMSDKSDSREAVTLWEDETKAAWDELHPDFQKQIQSPLPR